MSETKTKATSATCPACGSAVIYNYTCHTYEQSGRWSACLPCDSAIEYFCVNETCDWSYDHGLNPRNPRSENNEKHRPTWLDGWELHTQYGVQGHPGTTATWDRQ